MNLVKIPEGMRVIFLNREPKENIFVSLIKHAKVSGIGLLLGVGIFAALQVCGVKFGNTETMVILSIPFLTGILVSYVIF